MNLNLIILVAVSISVYLLIFIVHSLRKKFTLMPFYSLLGCCAVLMIVITDSGAKVSVKELTFLAGSTIFFTSLILGVFAIYIFDGSGYARAAISMILGITIFVPLCLYLMHILSSPENQTELIKMSSARLYLFSSLALLADFIFLAIIWQFLVNNVEKIPVFIRVFLTLLIVLIIDAVIFVTGAFSGSSLFWSIMKADVFSRIVLSLFASPFLAVYLRIEKKSIKPDNSYRPVFSILQNSSEAEYKLSSALSELKQREKIEEALRASEERYRLVFSNSPLGILHFDEYGIVVDLNQKLADILGVTKDKIIGINMIESLKNNAVISAVNDALKGKTGVFEGEYVSIISGKKMFLRGFFQQITSEKGKVLGAVGLFEDITTATITARAIKENPQMYSNEKSS